LNIVESIAARAETGKTALVANGRRLSFGELLGRATEVASWLNAAPGFHRPAVPRVGLACGNGLDYIALALGILQAGGCLVPIAGELTDEERREIVERTGLHGLLIGPDETWRADECVSAREPGCGAGWVPLDEPLLDCEAEFASLNPAFIRFSSGTTGTSKGIVISHETLLGRITAANAGLRIGPEDRVLWVLPMAHHFAVSIILYLYHGASTILAPASDPKVMLAMMREHGATVMYGSPYHYTMLSGQSDAVSLGSLRLAISTAFALNTEVAELFVSKTGLHLTQGMGIIEAGLPILNLEHSKDKPTSIGKPQPAFEVKLDDGELMLRGPGIFDAYLTPWQPREAVLRDGWFATGDIAEMDEDGCLYLRGRVRSVVNVGGLKCFPEEVEAVLCSHPGVKAARVSGRAHPALGAMPSAEIIPQNAEEPPTMIELRKLCQERLSAYKVPLFYTFVSELPMTPSGKLLRY